MTAPCGTVSQGSGGPQTAVALGIGAYAAAEKNDRSPAVWLAVVMFTVMASHYAASLLTAGLAGSNAIFSRSGGVLALVAVLAAPLAGLAMGGAETKQRVERGSVEDARMDGECVAITVAGSSVPLMLRASGDVPGGREGRAALTKSLARVFARCKPPTRPAGQRALVSC